MCPSLGGARSKGRRSQGLCILCQGLPGTAPGRETNVASDGFEPSSTGIEASTMGLKLGNIGILSIKLGLSRTVHIVQQFIAILLGKD